MAARKALANTQLRRNLGKATATIRAKRAAVVAELPDWEELRAAGQAIKAHTMRHLDHYLTELETQVTARGGTVHWARDAIEANRIVTGLVRATGAAEVVKVKSIVTDEIGLNDALADAGIHAIRDRSRGAHRSAGQDRPVAHPGARDPPQPGGDPRHLPARDGRRRPGADRRPRPR